MWIIWRKPRPGAAPLRLGVLNCRRVNYIVSTLHVIRIKIAELFDNKIGLDDNSCSRDEWIVMVSMGDW